MRKVSVRKKKRKLRKKPPETNHLLLLPRKKRRHLRLRVSQSLPKNLLSSLSFNYQLKKTIRKSLLL